MPSAPNGSLLEHRLIEHATVLSGLAQLLLESELDVHQTETVTEMIAACEDIAAICRALQP